MCRAIRIHKQGVLLLGLKVLLVLGGPIIPGKQAARMPALEINTGVCTDQRARGRLGLKIAGGR